jgi:hypothetical protein
MISRNRREAKMLMGQIGLLLDQASKSFLRSHSGYAPRDPEDTPHAALARCGIFTKAIMERRHLDAIGVEGGVRTVTVLVTISARFEAPDGSSTTVRALGQGTGDLLEATTIAAEDALRAAISTLISNTDGLVGNRGSEAGREDIA